MPRIRPPTISIPPRGIRDAVTPVGEITVTNGEATRNDFPNPTPTPSTVALGRTLRSEFRKPRISNLKVLQAVYKKHPRIH